jgi:hypothetical protein
VNAFDAVDSLSNAQIRDNAAKRISFAWRNACQDDNPVDQFA